jgi:hypothetical protein
VPYTQKQRAMFNARAKTDPKFRKLAEEANSMPVKKAAAKKPPRKGK